MSRYSTNEADKFAIFFYSDTTVPVTTPARRLKGPVTQNSILISSKLYLVVS